MKKSNLFIALMAAMFCLQSTALTAGELKIGENDSQTYYAPVYATWADKYYCSQILYSASELSDLNGQQITKLEFFLRATTGGGNYEKVQIRIKEVTYAAFESAEYESVDDATLVFEGTLLAGSETVLEAVLDEPYVYEGGNLLIDVRKIEAGGGYAPTSGNKGRFQATYGSEYTVLYNYGNSAFPTTCSRSMNRPDIRFTYSESAPISSCPKITSLASSDITAHEATLTWESEAASFQFLCLPKNVAPVWDGVATSDLKTITLDTLKSNTEYDFYIRAYCSETEQSAVKTISFKTDLSCYAPSGLTIGTVTSTTAEFSWTASGHGETQYQIVAILAGEEGTWDGVEPVTGTSATLTNLQPASIYFVYLRSYCGEDDFSDVIYDQFATRCGSIEAPWSENFDMMSQETVPNCWDNSASTTPTLDTYPYYVWGVFATMDGSQMLRMNNYFLKAGTALINTPSIVIPETPAYELAFDYAHTATCGAFVVKVSEDNGATFTAIGEEYGRTDETTTSYYSPGEFTPVKISLADYAGKTIILQLYAEPNYDAGAIFLDNIAVREATADPTAIENTAIKTRAIKHLENGTLVIEHNGIRYNAQGAAIR